MNNKVALVLQDLDLEIHQKEAEVIVGQLPFMTGHRRQLQQRFHNLIGNALKYHKPGIPPEIHMSSKLVTERETPLHLTGEEAEKKHHLIQVMNKGLAMSKKMQNGFLLCLPAYTETLNLRVLVLAFRSFKEL